MSFRNANRSPSRRRLIGIALSMMLSASGCSVAGSWEVAEWSAPESADVAVLSAVTLTADGRFTLTEGRDNRRNTTTGRYTFRGGTLTLKPHDGVRRAWACRYRGGASMTLANNEPGERWTATLRRRD